MLTVSGESMIEAGILDGDYILVKKQNVARNGEIVVALIGDEATVKTFYKESDHIRLQPENSTMDPIIVSNCEILGNVGLYVVSNLLIDAYIKTSYYKIETYDIDVKEANITIMTAKASKDDGHIEGKIVNNTNEKITNRYMKVELFSNNNINLGTEYAQIDELNPGDLKNFKINFTCDNVTSFKITFISEEQKNAEKTDNNGDSLNIINIDPKVENITNQLKVK